MLSYECFINSEEGAVLNGLGDIDERNKAMPKEPRYLIRFDDLCPTMNWTLWEQIEHILVAQDIRPIVAVIPDNRDPKLIVDKFREDFWERVRLWQAREWTVALHGYQHVYVNRNPGMLGITPQSEFAGLSWQEQEAKLRAGLAVFEAQGVSVDAWIAPSHSFDRTTVRLLAAYRIPVINDGLTTRPFLDRLGITWVPCQLGSHIVPKSGGIWTVCIHHNNWTKKSLDNFCQDIISNKERITSLHELLDSKPVLPLSWVEQGWAWGNARQLRLKRVIKVLYKKYAIRRRQGATNENPVPD